MLQPVVRTGVKRRGGIGWRTLPHDDPPWQKGYHSCRVWRLDGSWEQLNDALRELVRERTGRAAQPSAAILDRQSANKTEKRGLAALTEPRRRYDRLAGGGRSPANVQPASMRPTR